MTDSTLVGPARAASEADPVPAIYVKQLSFIAYMEHGKPGGYVRAAQALETMLDDIEFQLGERTIGESSTPFRVARSSNAPKTPEVMLPTEHRRQFAADYVRHVLGTASEEETGQCSPRGRAILLFNLSDACGDIWNEGLPYETLEAVWWGAERFVGTLSEIGEPDVKAALAAVRMTWVDSQVFGAINRGNSDKVIEVIKTCLVLVEETKAFLAAALRSTEHGRVTAFTELLQKASKSCLATEYFYGAIQRAASCLAAFERWMAVAPRFGSGQASESGVCQELYEKLNLGLTAAIADLEATLVEVGGDPTVASRFEPWLQLLIELRQALKSSTDENHVFGRVFVPKTVTVRSCFPFAVNYSHGKLSQEAVEQHIRSLDTALIPFGAPPKAHQRKRHLRKSDQLGDRLQSHLGGLFPDFTIACAPLPLSAFWLDSGYGVYGGKRIQLQNVLVGLDKKDADERKAANVAAQTDNANTTSQKMVAREKYEDWLKAHTYEVWIELSRMGNHCLCIQGSAPLDARTRGRGPLPHEVYREVRLATPWPVGENVVLAWSAHEVVPKGREGAKKGEPFWGGQSQWSGIREFAHDIVLRTAHALGDPVLHGDVGDEDLDYLPGNLHEVVTVKTDAPIVGADGEVIVKLDKLIGAEVLLRSANRVVSTLSEWLRVPVQTPAYRDPAGSVPSTEGRIAPLPFIGFSGDWFAYTGNMTVFGEVAVPSWLSMAYVEVAQFAATWVPLLELWSLRLEDEIRTAHGRRGHRSASASEQLRIVDQEIRRQTSQLRSAQLCQSHLHRRFLDIFLAESGVTRLEEELEAQLIAAERLADWYDEQRHRRAEDSRNFLLVLIGVFGVFGLASYLTLANGQDDPPYRGFFKFISSNPGREVEIVIFTFLGIFVVGLWVLRDAIRDMFTKIFGPLRNWHTARKHRRNNARRSKAQASTISKRPDT